MKHKTKLFLFPGSSSFVKCRVEFAIFAGLWGIDMHTHFENLNWTTRRYLLILFADSDLCWLNNEKSIQSCQHYQRKSNEFLYRRIDISSIPIIDVVGGRYLLLIQSEVLSPGNNYHMPDASNVNHLNSGYNSSLLWYVMVLFLKFTAHVLSKMRENPVTKIFSMHSYPMTNAFSFSCQTELTPPAVHVSLF